MGKVRVLLADDHEVVRAGIRKVIEELPEIEVVAEVGSGPALFENLVRYSIDCLIIDLMMPEFDPLNEIRQIRFRYPQAKILVVSAHNDSVYVQGLLGAGVNGYHLKDQPLSDLKLALQRILAGERWLSSPLIAKLVEPAPAPAPDVPAGPFPGGQARLTAPSGLFPGAQARPAAPALTGASMLTLRQKEILRLLKEGYDNQGIAQEMNLSVKTVENHLTRLYRQLDVQSRLEAVNYANQHPETLAVTGQEMSQLPDESGSQKDVSILLVDDNVRYLRQLQRVLGKVYPQAILYEAENILNAVQIAQRIYPRLVFVDVVLGEEDGIRCARRIKAVSPQSRIITISAYPDREFHRLSLEAGAVAFLDKKDLDAVTLRQVLEDVMPE